MTPTIQHTTTDYNKFQVFLFNRPILEGPVKRLMASITEIGYSPDKPILVDKTFAIIDGQHRYTACVRLGLPIHYVISNVDPHTAVIKLNAVQNRWQMQDYIHAWAEEGVSCYNYMVNFEKINKLGISNTLIICLGASIGSTGAAKLRKGEVFPINTDADKIVEFILQCKIVSYYKTTFFVKAVTKLFTLTDDKQRNKILKYIISLPQQATVSDYIMAFENIVNRTVKKSSQISFKSGML